MREQVIERIAEGKVIAIVRKLDARSLRDLARALVEGGVSLIELTFDQANPDSWADTCAGIRTLNGAFSGAVLAGAGTVLTAAQVEMAREAGAKYIISPDANGDVIGRARELGLVSIPGCMTPTEIAAALRAGADFIKIFPAGTLGADYVKAVRAPLNHARMLAVGGVDERNAAEFIRAGCMGVGAGGGLVNKEWIAAGEFSRITELARAYAKAVHS